MYFLSNLSLHGGLDLGRLRDGVGEVSLQRRRPLVRRRLLQVQRRREERLLGAHVLRRQRVRAPQPLLHLWKRRKMEQRGRKSVKKLKVPHLV